MFMPSPADTQKRAETLALKPLVYGEQQFTGTSYLHFLTEEVVVCRVTTLLTDLQLVRKTGCTAARSLFLSIEESQFANTYASARYQRVIMRASTPIGDLLDQKNPKFIDSSFIRVELDYTIRGGYERAISLRSSDQGMRMLYGAPTVLNDIINPRSSERIQYIRIPGEDIERQPVESHKISRLFSTMGNICRAALSRNLPPEIMKILDANSNEPFCRFSIKFLFMYKIVRAKRAT